jgi:hypothetical protein
MTFFHIKGRLVENSRSRLAIGPIRLRRLHFSAEKRWVAIRPAIVPVALSPLARPGTIGSFFFLRAFGLSLLFYVSQPEYGAASAYATVQYVRLARIAIGAGLVGVSIGLAPMRGLSALVVLFALLGVYNIGIGVTQSLMRDDAFRRAELDLATPGGSLKRS